ncbi:MAG: hypothetical protein ACJAV1_002209, partial [Paraglaciecola sp.]
KVVHFHDPFRFHIIPYFLKNREGLGQNAVAPYYSWGSLRACPLTFLASINQFFVISFYKYDYLS